MKLKGNEFCEELKSSGYSAEFFKVNVADYENVKENVDKVVAKYGTIDILS